MRRFLIFYYEDRRNDLIFDQIKIKEERLMPPSGFNKKAVGGLLQFVDGCYEDLLEAICSDESLPAEAKARVKEIMNHERSQIGKAVAALHIDDDGKLVKRTKT